MLATLWNTLCELAPWLLLGMAISGLLHVLLPQGTIRRGLQGPWGVVQAVLWGIPLPLCSCGVIPTGIGLKNQGASNGSAVGFLISTPQTGVDSILVSASFLGWPFAIYKVVVALVTGLGGGWLADWVSPPRPEPIGRELPLVSEARRRTFLELLRAAWDHALEIVRSIWLWLVFGIVVSAMISEWTPTSWIETLNQFGSWGAMLAVLLFSIPLYVCATASVPIAAALVSAGLPPSAALVFLVAGPATNITTIGAVGSRFGKRVLAVYLSSIIFGSMLFGWVFDLFFSITPIAHHHDSHEHLTWWNISSAIVILALLVYFAQDDLRRYWRRVTRRTHTGLDTQDRTLLSVTGMHCNSCVSKLEAALNQHPEISSSEVKLANETAIVIGKASWETIAGIVTECGFIPAPLTESAVRTPA